MRDALPDALARHALELFAEARHPAWVRVGPEGLLREMGGALLLYGISGLHIGESPLDALPLLEGLLPLGGRNVELPYVLIGQARYADVYLTPAEDGDWVLLLDSSRAGYVHRELQQRYNEALLAVEAASVGEAPAAFGALEILVLRRTGPERFRVAGPVPAWAREWIPDRQASVDPSEASPFLASFLPDAEALWRGEAGGQLRSGPWTETFPGGTPHDLEASAIRLENGSCLLLVATAESALEQTRAVMQRAREAALEHQRLVKEVSRNEVLLHCIVHDLRGPLSAMIGSLGLLGSGSMETDEARNLIELALRQGKKQEGMIRGILDAFSSEVARLEGKASELVIVSLAEVARGVIADQRVRFVEQRVVLELSTDGDGSGRFTVRGDASSFERVFANLLDNALRYTAGGGRVAMSLRRDGSHVVLAVTNDGPEVPRELRPGLFERFSGGGERGGVAGLGLFYCRLTVERFGGEIGYEVPESGGSRFVIRLPAAGE